MKIACPILLFAVCALGSKSEAQPLININQTVECDPSLDTLSVHQNSASKDTRCYLVPDVLSCLPNLTLKQDAHADFDVCRNSSGQLVSMPTCRTDKKFRYPQEIVQRRRLPVERKNGNVNTTSIQWVDMPFSVRTLTAKLATKTPLVRPGPDLCVYRLLTKVVGMTKSQRSVPEGRPAQYPARKSFPKQTGRDK